MPLTPGTKRLIAFLLAAIVPVAILSFYFPDRAFKGTVPETSKYAITYPGADIVVFVQEECPHCGAFKEYIDAQGWKVEYHEVKQLDSQKLFGEVQEHAPLLRQGVPTIVLNGQIVQGYDNDEVSGTRIKQMLEECRASPEGCLPFEEFLESDLEVKVISAAEGICTEECEVDIEKYIFNIWFIGEVDLTLLSLPGLAVLLGFLDGFNPCAMWVLISLLTLLIATRDIRKMIIITSVFLIVSGAMYYLFIAAWLNVFLIVGYNVWVQKVIGLIAIGAGGFYLYEALGKDPNVCHVTSHGQRQRTIERMRNVIKASAWPAMLIGVSILAISVNMIELICTAGLPAIFTQILAFNDVSNLYRYVLIGIYILLYMIDDAIIFFLAVFTLHATGITTKYRRFTLIFGGVLMYALGILLIFAPELLTFQ